MKTLQNVYVIWSEYQRTEVVKWVKQQITQNYFNCTLKPSSDPGLCKKLVKIVNLIIKQNKAFSTVKSGGEFMER